MEFVPKDYGLHHLKSLLFKIILEKWEERYPRFPVKIDDFDLYKSKNKSLAPILAILDDLGRDINCLASEFEPAPLAKGKRTSAKPKPAPTLGIIFIMKAGKYIEFDNWQIGDQTSGPGEEDYFQSPARPRKSTRAAKGKGKSVSEIFSTSD